MEEIFGGMATLASFDYIYGSKIGWKLKNINKRKAFHLFLMIAYE